MKNFYYLHNGRSALNFILKNVHLKNDQEILYPDFSCDVLFQYDFQNNYKYNFYQIKRDFKISLNLIKKKITKKTKIILVINFFGIKQNLKRLYKLCKKKDILLVVDDCHTFYNLKKSNNKDCDVKFFSPSKIFDEINIGGILQVNTNSLKITNKLRKSLFDYDFILNLKNKLKKVSIYKKLKFSRKRPKYEDQNFFESSINVNNFSLTKKNIKKINSINIFNENKKRKENFKFWVSICDKLKIKPLLKIKDIEHGCPLFFVAHCRNENLRKYIFDLGWKNKVNIISWPTLHSDQKKNKKVINYWKKLIYFPMNEKFYKKKKLLNEK